MPTRGPRAERTDLGGVDNHRSEYGLIDAGDGRRLERFGSRVVDRPAPMATRPRRRASSAWVSADLRFEPRVGWEGVPAALEPWTVPIDSLAMELRPTSSGGLGLYPEHAGNIDWLGERIRERSDGGRSPAVLNLFAHTGLVTLAAARAGASVAHVDGARGVVAWARRNAELSGFADRPIRWLVDDALAFVSREGRRGHRYEGIVLDPPSFGHAKGRRWRLGDELPELLAACRAVLAADAFVLLTAHSTGLDGDALAEAVRADLGGGRPQVAEQRLIAESGSELALGWSVRRTR